MPERVGHGLRDCPVLFDNTPRFLHGARLHRGMEGLVLDSREGERIYATD